jgi:replicative DNA helicase
MIPAKSDTALLLDEIYQRLDIASALPELEPKRTGLAFTLKCPLCEKKRAFIYEGGHLITCNRRNDCGYSSTLWDYVANKEGHTSPQQTLQALASLAGYVLPTTLSTDALEALKRSEVQQTRLETAQALLASRMFTDNGKKELAYLKTRGYTDDDIQTMGLGVIPPKSALDDMLKDAFVNNVNIVNTKITELSVTGYGATYTLSIPYRNKRGQLIGWSVRSISGADPKYKYSQGMETGLELFNLDQNRGLKNLVIVEAPLDALIATARGIQGVVACGRNKPTTKQLDDIKAFGVTSVTLALDSDEAGQKGTEDTLYALAERGIKGYVLTYPKGVKDLDEAIKEKGAETVSELIAKAQAGYSYLIKCLHSLHCKHEKLTDREQRELLNALIDLDAKLGDDLASKAITMYLTETLGLAPEIIKQALQENRATKAQAERERGYQSLQLKAGQLTKDGKYDDLEELYQENLPSLRAKNVNTIIEPYTSEHFISDIQQRREGYPTGWSKLDEYALIPSEALTIIAGRPSHGKTTVMLNMLYNLVTANSDESFYFFSYEETRSQLALKLMTIISGVQLDQYKNTHKIEEYYKTGRLDASYAKGLTESHAKQKLDEARAEYDDLVNSGRLWIIDEPLQVTDLTSTIETLADSPNRVGAVFIDYIQKIKSKYNAPTRQVEIQKISGDLLDTAKRSGVALVLGAQLNRGAEKSDHKNMSIDQLRESGDIEQDANLVLGLYNHNRGDYDANPDSEQTSDPVTQLDIKILKNRSGATNVYTSLTFDSPILTLTEDKKV